MTTTITAGGKLDAVAAVLEQVGHGTRLRILCALGAEPELSPNQYTNIYGGTVGANAYHFRLLRDRGWIRKTRVQHRRGAIESFYVLTAKGRRVLDPLIGVIE